MAVEFKIDHSILIVTVTGDWVQPTGEAAQANAASLMHEHAIDRVLLDLRQAKVQATTASIYEITPHLFDQFPAGTKHALVYAPVSEQVVADAKFFEDVAINRGINAKIFTDYAQAITWLQEAIEA